MSAVSENVVPVLARGAVVVEGPDTFGFLQSLLSQDVENLADGARVPSLLLTPQGRVVGVLRVVRRGPERAWLDCEPQVAAAVADALRRYRIRVAVEITDASTTWGMIAVRPSKAAGDSARAKADALAGADVAVLDTAWPGGDGDRVDGIHGVDVIGPVAALTALVRTDPSWAIDALDADAYERARVAAGVPRMGVDVDEHTIPQEAFLERDAVSFTKGCFLGQELVCRIDSRGHVNRFLRRFRPDDPGAVLAPGAVISVGGVSVGAITSSVPGVALGYVRRTVEVPVRADAAGAAVTVEEIPPR